MMKSFLFAVLLFVVAPASAGSFASSASSAGSATSGSTSGDNKVVVQARADAAAFVASDGGIRGARLQAALRLLRERRADARQATDMQLAQAILAR